MTKHDATELIEIGASPNWRDYFQEIWHYRHFIWVNGKTRARLRNSGFVLGSFWTVARPILDIAIYGLIFGVLLHTSRGVENFLPFLLVGVGWFGPLTNSLNDAAGLMRTYRNLLRSFNFPRAIIPLSGWVTAILNALPTLVIASGVGFILGGNFEAPYRLLLLIPLFFLMAAFTLGIFFGVSSATYFFPDLKVFISTISRIWFYVSGVFFSIDSLFDIDYVRFVSNANPAFYLLQLAREIVVYGGIGGAWNWAALTSLSVSCFLIGLLIFKLGESRYV